jgi:triosephosphate isomerase
MRTPLVAGNWKMHKGPADGRRLALEIRNGLMGRRLACDVVLCPPFPTLSAVLEIIHGSGIALGAQNVFWEASGAWTGEVAAPMLRDAGCDWVLAGHSERRQHFGETDATVAKRVRAGLDAGLHVIACVGETLAEREAGRTQAVVEAQLRNGLGGLGAADWPRLAIAYEPVWAIGTGRNATPEQAQEVHAFIRGVASGLASSAAAENLRIQYGGSVKAENAAALLAQPDVDGALVGGASLEAVSFLQIVGAAAAPAGSP